MYVFLSLRFQFCHKRLLNYVVSQSFVCVLTRQLLIGKFVATLLQTKRRTQVLLTQEFYMAKPKLE